MATSQDVNPLDNFFRNTLENLPDTPGESGWDAPSDRVWQQVHAGIKTPRAGWSTQTWVVAGMAAIVVFVALFFVAKQRFGSSDTPQNTELPQVEPPHPALDSPAAPSVESTTPEKSLETPKPSLESAKKAGRTGPKVPKNSTEDAAGQVAPENQGRPHPKAATPLPGSKDVPHNTKEANEQKKNDKAGGN